VYLIPELESKILEGFKQINSDLEEEKRKGQENINLVRNEIKRQLNVVGGKKFPDVDKITAELLDQKILGATLDFLKTFKTYSLRRQSKAMALKD